jgi:hypothetical protein
VPCRGGKMPQTQFCRATVAAKQSASGRIAANERLNA